MSSDVERLIDAPESISTSDSSTTSRRENSNRGIWENIYLYKMPQLTQEQLIGFSTKYKVFSSTF